MIKDKDTYNVDSQISYTGESSLFTEDSLKIDPNGLWGSIKIAENESLKDIIKPVDINSKSKEKSDGKSADS